MTGKKFYVGNLKYSVTNEQVKELFSHYGYVTYVNVLEKRGYGFVEMETREMAETAFKELNGKEFEGRALRLKKAHPSNRTHREDHVSAETKKH